MKAFRQIFECAVLLCMFVVPARPTRAQSLGPPAVNAPHLSRHELNQLRKEDQTPEACDELARYYLGRAQKYRDDAWQMNGILLERSVVAANAGGHYWSILESGRDLKKYYRTMSHEMQRRADFYQARRQRLLAQIHCPSNGCP